MDTTTNGAVGRRVVLRGAVALAVLAGATGTVDAQKKAAQKMVQYQQKPKGTQECDECLHFEPPQSCKLVEGTINPKGWCSLFAAKPKAK
jgi:hypothetical protein